MKELTKDLLEIKIYATRHELGRMAAHDAAQHIRSLFERKEEINILFAAAPSQNEFLEALRTYPIDWRKINAFHMDEYIGLEKEVPQRFGNYLDRNLFSKISLKSVHYLFSESSSPEEVCRSYTEKLAMYPLDIIFMGIGENGYITFNDPHVALFDDPEEVKVVTLDEVCRNQQVNDGCFPSLEEVPSQAITLTIPSMMKAHRIFCIVPAESKAKAIVSTVNGPITSTCSASILRTHPAVTLYCDSHSAQYII